MRTPSGSVTIATSAERTCQRKRAQTRATTIELLDQLVGEVVDRAVDQLGAVIGRDDLDPRRQAALQLGELAFTAVGSARVLARAQDDDAAGDLALAVQLGHPGAAPARSARCHDRPASARRRGGLHAARRAEVVRGLQVAVGADRDTRSRHLRGPIRRPPGWRAGRLTACWLGDAVGGQLHRIEHHLVFAHHAADAGDLGDAGHALQLVAQEPVLDAAKLGRSWRPVRSMRAYDPAHARWRRLAPADLRRQAALDLVEIFEHPRARPVEVGPCPEQAHRRLRRRSNE